MSTIEAEYHGIIHVSAEVAWILYLLGEPGFPIQTLNTLYCDNHSVIQVVDNLVSHINMKHVDLHAHYLR
jgi:hypothetical protein